MNKLIFGYVRPHTLQSLLGKTGPSWEVLQGATLTFAGDVINEAITAFAKFVSQSQDHDHKAAQQGQFIFTKGSVSSSFWSVASRIYRWPDS